MRRSYIMDATGNRISAHGYGPVQLLPGSDYADAISVFASGRATHSFLPALHCSPCPDGIPAVV